MANPATGSNSFASSEGFPSGTRSLPVPSPLLGSLLEAIDDIAELKCTLRFLWHAAQVGGAPKLVAAASLENDEILIGALGSPDEVRRGLGLAVERGTLIQAAGHYLLHTPENVRAASRLQGPAPVSQPEKRGPRERRNVFELYESNIGMLTPMIADQLREAETEYPAEWIEQAIREAVERNARSWRYIATILERWAHGGRSSGDHGEPGRHTETTTAAEYLRRRRTAG